MIKNNYSDEEIELIHDYKSVMFDIINSNSIDNAIESRYKLYEVNTSLPMIINDLTWKLIIPKFKKITNHLTDNNIALTSNKIENYFLKNFPKYIKRFLNQMKVF